jgi:ubiquinone/menaquinone biosynthesis C-methylase UbiE
MTGWYDTYIMPRFVNLACGLKPVLKQREKVVPLASGRVLEIGIGSGLNLPFYDASQVEHVWGLDPSPEMWALVKDKADNLDFGFEFIEASAEDIPLDSDSADTVLITYTMCTIPDAASALKDARRVLKPGGRLVFCEHGEAPDANVRKWQNRINPLWQKLAGGCNLNRPIPAMIEDAGFRIDDLDTMYIPGWKPATFNFWGTAKIR